MKKGLIAEANRLATLRETIKIPYELSYVEGSNFENYLNDMKIAQAYAALNRKLMAETILKGMKWDNFVISTFDCTHNYIDTENLMLRKGATSAQKGEALIVPLNMRDGSILATGLGNPAWNYSAPHGAGRILSRSKAKAQISLDSYQKTMRHVWSTSVSKHTLDEAPSAYKPSKQLQKDVTGTMKIQEIIKPLYNFKG